MVQVPADVHVDAAASTGNKYMFYTEVNTSYYSSISL